MAEWNKIERGLEAAESLLMQLHKDHGAMRVVLARLEQTVKHMAENQIVLLKIVRDGNGRPALTHKVVELESDVDSIEERLKAQESAQAETKKAKLALYTALGTGLLGFLGHVGKAIADAIVK